MIDMIFKLNCLFFWTFNKYTPKYRLNCILTICIQKNNAYIPWEDQSSVGANVVVIESSYSYSCSSSRSFSLPILMNPFVNCGSGTEDAGTTELTTGAAGLAGTATNFGLFTVIGGLGILGSTTEWGTTAGTATGTGWTGWTAWTGRGLTGT